jgi:hypothetical protein
MRCAREVDEVAGAMVDAVGGDNSAFDLQRCWMPNKILGVVKVEVG